MADALSFGFTATDNLDVAQLRDETQHLTSEINGRFANDETAITSALSAEGTSYSPARPGDWAGTAPTTVAEALDRLAYVLSSAGDSPVAELP